MCTDIQLSLYQDYVFILCSVYFRMEFLSKWKRMAGIDATYENLVKALLKIEETTAAEFIVQLWPSKSLYTITGV